VQEGEARAREGAQLRRIREPTDTAVDLAIAACDGNARAAIRALIILVGHLEEELSRARRDISRGYVRGRNVTPR
jgi:hypothetical protein